MRLTPTLNINYPSLFCNNIVYFCKTLLYSVSGAASLSYLIFLVPLRSFTMKNTALNANFFTDKNAVNCIPARIARTAFKTAITISLFRPALAVALNIAIMIVISAVPGLAQAMPNPFGGSGTTKLSNAGSNILVILTWVAFVIGLGSFVLIPAFIFFNKPYGKLIISGATGLGGFVVIGSIAYDIMNLNSIDMQDPTIGH
jgi:hypothetical protein